MAGAHVVHFTVVHPPGDARILHKECRTLADAGYRVTLVAPGVPPADLGEVEFVALPVRSSRRERMLRGTFDAARALAGLDAAVYHFHDPELLPLGAWLRARGKRVVYDAHESYAGSIATKPYLPGAVARPLGRAVGAFERAVGRRLSGVVVAEPVIAGQFPFPTTLVANYPIVGEFAGIDAGEDAYRRRPPAGAYVGAISSLRCRDEMVAAAALVASRHEAFRMRFAGRVVDAGGEPQGSGVDYAGVLDRPELVDLLSRSRFGVLVLRPVPNYVGSQPTKLYEYLAAGLPVIVSRSLVEAVRVVEAEGCGVVVDDGDVPALARAMEGLLADPGEAYAMGARGRRAVLDRYSWAGDGERLVRFYESLLLDGQGSRSVRTDPLSIRLRRLWSRVRTDPKGAKGARGRRRDARAR